MIVKQLAAAIEERLEIRVQGVNRPAVHFFGTDDVGIEIEVRYFPLRILNDIAELIKAGRSRRCRPADVGPPQLAASRQTGDLAPGFSDWSGMHR